MDFNLFKKIMRMNNHDSRGIIDIKKLELQKNSELVRQILSDPTTQTKLAALDMDASWNSPQAFRTLVDTEGRKWAGVVKASGFKADQ